MDFTELQPDAVLGSPGRFPPCESATAIREAAGLVVKASTQRCALRGLATYSLDYIHCPVMARPLTTRLGGNRRFAQEKLVIHCSVC
jgi:hypothetical protein